MTSLFDRLAGLFREPSAGGPTGTQPPTGGSDATASVDRPGESVGAVAVVLQRAPAGVRRYDLRVTVPDAAATTVEPGLLAAHFDGSTPDDTTVRLRAVDFTGEGRPVEGAVPLATLRFDDPVPVEAVSLSVAAALDQADGALPHEWIRLTPVDPADDPTDE